MSTRSRSTAPATPTEEYPRLLVAGTGSSAGKTLVAAGLLEAFRAEGGPVAGYKCGPDFLDPAVLSVAARSPARNLDPFLLSPSLLRTSFVAHAPPGPRGLSLVEGVMGILDTRSWGTSSADVADLLSLPIVLVLDARSSSETLGMVAAGARRVLGAPPLGGFVLNGVAEGWHSRATREAVEKASRLPVLGTLPWSPLLHLPERHLGLVNPRTDRGFRFDRWLGTLGGMVRERFDLPALRSLARSAPRLPSSPAGAPAVARGGRRSVVAVARDEAFSFLYPENLEVLERAGARVRTFSPVRGDALPPTAEALYLPGGYPELFGKELGENGPLRREVRQWVREGRPLYAECGGMMFLLHSLRDGEGRTFPMAGAFPGRATLSPRLGGFGYVTARARRPCPLGAKGAMVRGHLYHHSVREAPRDQSWALTLRPRAGGAPLADGYGTGAILASYLHVRLDTVDGFAARFLGEGAGPGSELDA